MTSNITSNNNSTNKLLNNSIWFSKSFAHTDPHLHEWELNLKYHLGKETDYFYDSLTNWLNMGTFGNKIKSINWLD